MTDVMYPPSLLVATPPQRRRHRRRLDTSRDTYPPVCARFLTCHHKFCSGASRDSFGSGYGSGTSRVVGASRCLLFYLLLQLLHGYGVIVLALDAEDCALKILQPDLLVEVVCACGTPEVLLLLLQVELDLADDVSVQLLDHVSSSDSDLLLSAMA